MDFVVIFLVLTRIGLQSMKKVLTAPVKNLLVPLGLTSAALAASSNVFGTTSSTIPNKEMNDIKKIIKS